MCDTIAGDGSTAINQLLNVIIYVRAAPGAPTLRARTAPAAPTAPTAPNAPAHKS